MAEVAATEEITASAAEEITASASGTGPKLTEEEMASALKAVEAEFGVVEEATEWEKFKENVQPMNRGRKIALLNQSLRSYLDPAARSHLLIARRKMIEAIGEYTGNDPLQPWLVCIKWVQECFPSGGDYSGLIVLYEQCVRSFWHDGHYKDDLRYLKVWLEYAENCADAEVIYRFLEANEIGQAHSLFYLAYAKHMEAKNKLKKAEEILSLGISRKAKPLEKLEAFYRSYIRRAIQKNQSNNEVDELDVNPLPPLPPRSFGNTLNGTESRVRLLGDTPQRSFGTPLNGLESRAARASENGQVMKPRVPLLRMNPNQPLRVYKDGNSVPGQCHHKVAAGPADRTWQELGTRSERNKENTAAPAKWTSYKVPQRPGIASARPPTPTIEVYVDEDCTGLLPPDLSQANKQSLVKLAEASDGNLKKETELLKENPLRNFSLRSMR